MDSVKILLVDDEVTFVDAMADRLVHRGFEIRKAYDGPEALSELSTEHHFDVVILDLKMPGIDGLEVLREIKSQRPLVEVIILTGQAAIDTATEGIRRGAFDYLIKPIELDDLIDKVTAAVKQKRRHDDQVAEVRSHWSKMRRGLSRKFEPDVQKALGFDQDN